MTKEEKISILKMRLARIVSKGKHLDSPGAYKKVLRQIKELEK